MISSAATATYAIDTSSRYYYPATPVSPSPPPSPVSPFIPLLNKHAGRVRSTDVTTIQCFQDKVWRHEKLVRTTIVCDEEGVQVAKLESGFRI